LEVFNRLFPYGSHPIHFPHGSDHLFSQGHIYFYSCRGLGGGEEGEEGGRGGGGGRRRRRRRRRRGGD